MLVLCVCVVCCGSVVCPGWCGWFVFLCCPSCLLRCVRAVSVMVGLCDVLFAVVVCVWCVCVGLSCAVSGVSDSSCLFGLVVSVGLVGWLG